MEFLRAEIAYGVARLPDGQRKTVLAVKVSELLTEDFHDQILPTRNTKDFVDAGVALRDSWGDVAEL